MFARSVESKSVDMRRQQRKQERLIYKMLPKVVVDKMKSGEVRTFGFRGAEWTQINNI